MMQWHRLLGIALKDLFSDTDVTVEQEKDLSLKQQFLDLVIISLKEAAVPIDLPDGLETMTRYNLLTFKSKEEALNRWAMDELMGHFVNFRKMISPEKRPLPYDLFSLYGVTMRFPMNLDAGKDLKQIKRGVYEVQWGLTLVRILVLREMPEEARNAIWQLFSGDPNKVSFGQANFRWKQKDTSTIVRQLYDWYDKVEGLNMPYTMQDYRRDTAQEILTSVTPAEQIEILEILTPDQRTAGMSPDQLAKRLTPDQRLDGLSPDQRLDGLSPDQRLDGLSPGEILTTLSPKERAALKKLL